MSAIKSLTLMQSIIVAVILILVAMIVIRRGLINSLLWIAAIVLVVIGVVNHLSYNSGGG